MHLPRPVPLRDAETDLVWVIVPFSRPENIEHVLANFLRQKFANKKLVLVENGRARGAGRDLADKWRASSSLLVLTSESHQSAAKNTGLAEIKKRGGGFCVTMDDDDWYGPQYLTEACGYAKTYDVIGKNRHFVSMDGSLWLCAREHANRPAAWLTGGTIACWAESAPEYPTASWGEDAMFCQRALKQGMTLFGTDLYHYLYRRSSNAHHAWRIAPQKLREHESERGAFDLGHLGQEELRVVTGERLVEVKSLLACREDAAMLVPTATPYGVTHVAT